MTAGDRAMAIRATCCLWMALGAPLAARAAQDPAAAAAPAALSASAPAGATVHVTAWRVDGNTLLPAADVQAALSRWLGDRTLPELQDAASQVQSLYARAGYGGVVAYLPPQTPADGVMRLVVVEGKLARVIVRGAGGGDEALVRASLPSLAQGRTPDLRRLDAEIAMSNANPSRQEKVTLRPGEHPGESDAVVDVVERPPRQWSVGLDNTGTTRTGHLRASVTWQAENLAGRDDVTSVQWQTAPAHVDRVNAVSAGWHLPLYRDLATVDVYGGYADIDGGTTSTAVGNLQFTGKSRAFGARLTLQGLRQGDVSSHLAIGLDERAYLNQCAIAGLPDGACGAAGESVAVQPATIEYAVQGAGRAPWGLSVSMQANFVLGGSLAQQSRFDIVRPGATQHYVLVHAGGGADLPLGGGWHLPLRASGQYTGDALVLGEQYGIGGVASVRGFEERELSGDRGASASASLASPAFALPGLDGGRADVVAFGDGGWVQDNLGTPCEAGRDRCHLYGAGLGTRLAWRSLKGQLYVAEALSAGAATRRHAVRLHFSLAYGF